MWLLFSGLSRVQLSVTHGLQHQAPLILTLTSWNLSSCLHKSVIPSNHLILCCPFPYCLVFPESESFSESALYIRWPYWSFSFSCCHYLKVKKNKVLDVSKCYRAQELKCGDAISFSASPLLKNVPFHTAKHLSPFTSLQRTWNFMMTSAR